MLTYISISLTLAVIAVSLQYIFISKAKRPLPWQLAVNAWIALQVIKRPVVKPK